MVSSVNHRLDPRAYIDRFPVERVGEIHLVGYDETVDGVGDRLLIDAHGSPVKTDVMAPIMDANVQIVPTQDGIFAQALFAGATLGEAAEAALGFEPNFDLGAALVGLHALGAFAGLKGGDMS